jgi:hypothetical protein
MATFKDCQFCGVDHATFARTMSDGSTHVYQSAQERARRVAAGIAFNKRVAAVTEAEARLLDGNR